MVWDEDASVYSGVGGLGKICNLRARFQGGVDVAAASGDDGTAAFAAESIREGRSGI